MISNEEIGMIYVHPLTTIRRERVQKYKKHFEATRRGRSSVNGYYRKRRFRNWKYKIGEDEGYFRWIRDNGDGTFHAYEKGLFAEIRTENWADLTVFR